MKLVVVASLFTSTFAACANSCSQHGSCGEHDKCKCDPNWMGGDCSLAKCPYGASWSVSTDGAEYAECSSRGACDRKNGVCKCLAGYSGASCQRTDCPESCSGHGVCGAAVTKGSRSAVTEQQSCVCDGGWSGVTCSDRLCPFGDDPLTKSNYDGVLGAAVVQQDEVQRIRIASQNIQTFTVDTFTLTYTTVHGEEYTTYPIYQLSATAGQVERALENLPDGVLANVTVSASRGNYYNEFEVTFVANPGDQVPVRVNTEGCNIAGCIPQYYGFSGAGATITYTEVTKGSKENVECAGRGTCNREDATCGCFPGFYGEACDEQSILA